MAREDSSSARSSLVASNSHLGDRVVVAAGCALLAAPAGAILAASVLPVPFGVCVAAVLPAVLAALAVLAVTTPHSGLSRKLGYGLAAGAAATAAYDLVRVALWLVDLVDHPFRTITLYGEAMLPGSPAASAAGWGFHLWNGLVFAMFFVATVHRPSILKGVAWALLLDAMQTVTLTEVPGMTVGQEFLTASIVGHLAYGATLGWLAAKEAHAMEGGKPQ